MSSSPSQPLAGRRIWLAGIGGAGMSGYALLAHAWGAERRVMVEIDVEQHGDFRSQRADGAIRLVPFDHQPTGPRSGVAAELWHVAADQERRLQPEPVEAEGDHRARRRLPVRARHNDRAPLHDELGEEIGARTALDPARKGRRDEHLPSRRRRRRLWSCLLYTSDAADD